MGNSENLSILGTYLEMDARKIVPFCLLSRFFLDRSVFFENIFDFVKVLRTNREMGTFPNPILCVVLSVCTELIEGGGYK